LLEIGNSILSSKLLNKSDDLCPPDMYPSPNIVRVIKSRKMTWAGHIARMGRGEACTGFWWRNLREKDHWEDPGVDWRIILR
jgi:hypothetical protein